MISAEYYALETKAVQSMLAIRQRELDYINVRMNALGTQAALIAGEITYDTIIKQNQTHKTEKVLSPAGCLRTLEQQN